MSEKILDRLEVNERGTMRPAWQLIDMGEADIQSPSFGVRKGYRMKLVIGTDFAANDAELSEAQKAARRLIARKVFGPLLDEMHELEVAVHSHDAEACLKLIARMRDMML